jgi:tetratricopeptide (TPR) repeat protein
MLLGASVGVSAWSQSAKNGLLEANAALQAGEADKALVLLASLPQPQVESAQAHNLRCRVLFALEQWDAAGGECQQAVNLDGQNADYHLWLGRALGERASRSSFVNAYGLAKRTRAEFEAAVQLNPHDAEALADLGEFYKSAPSVVGGGISKAQAVAAQLDKTDPARAHELRGRIAVANKDYDGAEREFKQAIAVSQHPAFQWTTLASFYRKRERWNDMESALKSTLDAVERDRHAGVALYNGASLLIKTKRNPQLAARMLEAYLAGPAKTEEAPAFVAHVWLARLDAQRGDSSAAQRERAAALAMANEYKPAQDLKDRSE